MKPSFGSVYLDDNKTLIQHNTLHSFHVINWGYGVGHYLKIFIINIWASKNISGLVNFTVTSPAGLVKFFLNVEPCWVTIYSTEYPEYTMNILKYTSRRNTGYNLQHRIPWIYNEYSEKY